MCIDVRVNQGSEVVQGSMIQIGNPGLLVKTLFWQPPAADMRFTLPKLISPFPD